MAPTTFSDAMARTPVRPFQWAIIATCMLVLVCDGIDLQLLGIVAPLVIDSFGTTRDAFGLAMGAALVGFGLGSWSGGKLGDAIGRRWTLALAALVFSLATMGASLAGDVVEMAWWRVVSGLGFGAAYANALALVGEWLPDRWRSVAVSTLSVGTPIGGTIVGWIGPDLATAYGWDGAFVRIGFATLALVVVIVVVLRDSPSFLLAFGRREAAQRNARLVLAEDVELVPERHSTDGPDGAFIGVLDRSNLRLNIGIALAFAGAAMVAYSILSWTTVMLTDRGVSLQAAGDVVALAGITSIVGSVIVGLAIRHYGSKPVMLLISAALVALLIASAWAVERLSPVPAGDEVALVKWLLGASAAFFSAGIAGMYVMMTFAYPQSCRSAGIGFGIFMSRVGAISATLFGGSLLTLGGASVLPFFAVLVASACLIAAAAFVVDRHVPPLAVLEAVPGHA